MGFTHHFTCFSLHCIHLTFFYNFYKVFFNNVNTMRLQMWLLSFPHHSCWKRLVFNSWLERPFPAFVMWKTQCSHVLLTIFSHCLTVRHKAVDFAALTDSNMTPNKFYIVLNILIVHIFFFRHDKFTDTNMLKSIWIHWI